MARKNKLKTKEEIMQALSELMKILKEIEIMILAGIAVDLIQINKFLRGLDKE